MNRVLRGLFAFSLLFSIASLTADSCCNTCCSTGCSSSCGCDCDCDNCCLGQCDGYPFLSTRSQGRDASRQLVGEQQFINKFDMDSTYGCFSVTANYERSFRNERLAHFLFGNDLVNCCQLYIQGSNVANRNAKAWYADYFGLSQDFDGRIKFCPQIQNAVIDLNFFLGLDEAAEGLFIRVNAPIVWTKWELCPCECVISTGTSYFPAGYMAEAAVARTDMANSFMQATNGCYKWGDMQSPLKFARFNGCDCTKTRLGEIDFTLGWNFHLEEDSHFGIFAYVAAPAGSRPCATFLFEPVVGNGKHWELGGGVTGSWIFWRSEEQEDRYMGLWLEATVAHLFKACQCRTFDFCCKAGSRYMLLEEIVAADGELTGEASTYTAATYQYAGNLIPAANWSTFNVDVKIDVQADIALKLGWVRENWNFDLGYNLWARTGEKFCDDCCSCCTSKMYAIKGNAPLYGEEGQTTTNRALGWTQSDATIYGPKLDSDSEVVSDNLEKAFYTTSHTPLYTMDGLKTATTNTSIQSVLATKCLLNMGKSPSAITHKVFAHIGYAWKDRDDDYVPFLGIGGKVEFAQSNYKDCCCCDSCCDSCCGSSCDSCCSTGCNTSCNTCCDSSCGCGGCGCNNCCNDCCSTRRENMSSWGVWIKGGVAFD